MENQKAGSINFDDLNPYKIGNTKDRRDYYRERTRKQACENLADTDDSPACHGGDCSPHYNPKDYEIVARYERVSTLYELPLSPSIITLTTCKDSGEKVVKKTLLKDKLITDEQIKAAKIECVLHSRMNHENVVKLYNYSENDSEFALVMEYANMGTHLQEMILDRHTPIEDEQELQVYAFDLLNGLHHIHSNGIIHCDVKLDNMCGHKEDDDQFPIIKFCDFGLAHQADPKLNDRAPKKNTVGTWGYIAPEVKNNKYVGKEADVWSLGLTLYEMAVAYKPTQVKNYKYEDGPLPFRKPDWRGKSEELKNLISACMEYDPEKRINVEDALQHPYFTTQV